MTFIPGCKEAQKGSIAVTRKMDQHIRGRHRPQTNTNGNHKASQRYMCVERTVAEKQIPSAKKNDEDSAFIPNNNDKSKSKSKSNSSSSSSNRTVNSNRAKPQRRVMMMKAAVKTKRRGNSGRTDRIDSPAAGPASGASCTTWPARPPPRTPTAAPPPTHLRSTTIQLTPQQANNNNKREQGCRSGY